MTTKQLHNLVANHLEYLADRVAYLHTQGEPEAAAILQQEGLEMAAAFDQEETFIVLGGLTGV